MITERFTRNCNKVEVLKWVIARMQPNGIRDKREDAPQNSAITISWQGNDVAVSAADDSQAPVNIGADYGYRPRWRSDRPVFKAPPTPPPPDAAAATFAIDPIINHIHAGLPWRSRYHMRHERCRLSFMLRCKLGVGA